MKKWMPIEVNDVDIAFGGKIEILMPDYETVPEEFKKRDNQWVQLIQKWFYNGFPKNVNVEPKENVDAVKAIRHIHCILKSFAPKHEHKIAGCAYLLSEFFDDFELLYEEK